MATTRKKITDMMDAKDFRYDLKGEDEIVFGMRMHEYRDAEGDDGLLLVVSLLEDGEYFRLFAPHAYKAQGPHKGAFLEACMQCQWRTKLIQFEYDPSDGEIRPIIEFPLEDAELTPTQLHRCINGMCSIIDAYHPTFRKVLETGLIEMPSEGGGDGPRMPTPMAASRMIQALLADGRSADDPLIRQLRTLLDAAGEPEDGPPDEL